jgi:hypothetical protein
LLLLLLLLLGVVIDGEKGNGGRDRAGFGATIDEVFDALRIACYHINQQKAYYPQSNVPHRSLKGRRSFHFWARDLWTQLGHKTETLWRRLG